MFNLFVPNQEHLLREIIADYEDDLAVAREQLDMLRVNEAKLRYAMEELKEHGELDEARRVQEDLNVAIHRVRAQEELIQRMERLLDTYRKQLVILERQCRH